MQDETGIDHEIAVLREQIAAAEATMALHQNRADTAQEPGGATSPAGAELGEVVEAHQFMVARLSRLQSCKRTPDE